MRSAYKWPHETHAESHVNAQSEPIVSDLIWIDLNTDGADSPEAEIAEKLKKKKRLQTFGAPAALLQMETLQTGNIR